MSLRHVLPVALIMVGSVGVPTASATSPGTNGSIAYSLAPFAAKFKDSGYLATSDLYLVSEDGLTNRRLTDTPALDDRDPYFSPDGAQLAFDSFGSTRATSGIRIADVATVTSHTLADSGDSAYPSWTPKGTLLFVAPNGLSTVGVSGAPPASLLFPGKAPKVIFGGGEMSPDGSTIYFLRYTVKGSGKHENVASAYWAMGSDGSNPHVIFGGAGSARVPQDFDVSPDGKSIVFLATKRWGDDATKLYTVGTDGTGVHPVGELGLTSAHFQSPVWSPDGSEVVVAENADYPKYGAALAVFNPITGTSSQLHSAKRGSFTTVAWQPLPPA